MFEIQFADKSLERLETDARYSGGYPQAIVRSFRKVMQFVRAANDERDLYAMKGLRFEKLKGNRSHQRSFRLNDQWRLIIEIRQIQQGKAILVVEIEDYH